MTLISRAFSLRAGSSHLARDIDREPALHTNSRTTLLISARMSPDAARQEAIRQFGDMKSVREVCLTMDHERDRAMRRANMLDELRQDFFYAARVLRRNFGFAATVIVTLALGIGA